MKTPTSLTGKLLRLLTIVSILFISTDALIAQNYASMFMAKGGETKRIMVNENWTLVGNGSAPFTQGPMSSWNMDTNNTLTVEPNGVGNYIVKYTLGFSGGYGNWEIGILLNNSILIKSSSVNIYSKKSQIVNVASEAQVMINPGDYVTMVIRSKTGDAKFLPIHARLSLIEYDGELPDDICHATFVVCSATEYKSVDWAMVSGFTGLASENTWEVSDNNIIATAETAGTYLVSYSSWFLVRTGSNGHYHKVCDNISFGLTKNGQLESSLLPNIETKVSDIRNEFVSGFGVIKIAAGDNINMKVKAGKKQAEVVIYRAKISLYKLTDNSPLAKTGLPSLDTGEQPGMVTLEQNYPNPFNPTTQISYSLQNASWVSITIYDMRGAVVNRLLDAHQELGNHSLSFDATDLNAGTYIYVLETPMHREVRKMSLVK